MFRISQQIIPFCLAAIVAFVWYNISNTNGITKPKISVNQLYIPNFVGNSKPYIIFDVDAPSQTILNINSILEYVPLNKIYDPQENVIICETSKKLFVEKEQKILFTDLLSEYCQTSPGSYRIITTIDNSETPKKVTSNVFTIF